MIWIWICLIFRLNRFYRRTYDMDLDMSDIPLFLREIGFLKKGYIKKSDSRQLLCVLTKDYGYITLFTEEPGIRGEKPIKPTDFSGTLYVSEKRLNDMNEIESETVLTLIESRKAGSN